MVTDARIEGEPIDPPAFGAGAARVTGAGLLMLLVAWSVAHFLAFQYFHPDALADATRGPLSPKRGLLDLLEVAPWAALLTGGLWALTARGLRRAGSSGADAWVAASWRVAPLGLLATALWFDDPAGRQFLAAALVGLVAWRVWPALAPALERLAVPNPHARDRARIAAWVMCAVAGAALFAGALARHEAHWSSLIDLGLFYELYDNAAGQALYSPTLGHTFLGEHFSPILYALWPLMQLFPSPVTLLAVQSGAIALGGLLLFTLARDRLRHGPLALVIMAAYLLSPYVQAAAFYDFHMDMLEPPMVFGLLVALHRRRAWLVWLCAILLWLTKEDTFIYTSVFGAYAALFLGQRRLGLALVGVGLAVGLASLLYVVPGLREAHVPGAFATTGAAEGYAFAERYGHLGQGLGQVIASAATNPFYVVDHLTSGPRLSGVLGLVLSFGALALAARWRLLLLVPVLEMVLASPNQVSALSFYYGAVAFMFAPLVAIEGARILRARPSRWLGAVTPGRLAVALGVLTWLIAAWHPSSQLSAASRYKPTVITPHHERARALMDQIPAGASVSATGYLAVHLQPGRDVAMFPFGLERAEWALIDLQRPPWPRTLAHVHQEVLRLSTRGFRLLDAGDGLLLFSRHAPHEGVPTPAQSRRLADDHLRLYRVEAELSEHTAFPSGVHTGEAASNDAFRRARASDRRGPGYVLYGPFMPLWKGEYTAVFRVRWRPEGLFDRPPARLAVTLDVVANAGRHVRAKRDYTVEAAGVELGSEWREVRLDLSVGPSRADHELRVYHHGVGVLDVDAVWLEPSGDR